MTTATTPLLELLSAPLDQNGTIEEMAERLLALVATGPSLPLADGGVDSPNGRQATGLRVTYDDLTDRQSQRLIRPLLACLAQRSEAESGTSVNLFGGTLSFVRPGKVGRVRITGEFENRPGAVRLAFRCPVPEGSIESTLPTSLASCERQLETPEPSSQER